MYPVRSNCWLELLPETGLVKSSVDGLHILSSAVSSAF